MKLRQHADVELSDQDVRRKALNLVIKNKYDGNVSAFARYVKKPPAQIADMLAGRKKFGEKIARQLEKRAQLAKGLLDKDPDDGATRANGGGKIIDNPFLDEELRLLRKLLDLPSDMREAITDVIANADSMARQLARKTRRTKEPQRTT